MEKDGIVSGNPIEMGRSIISFEAEVLRDVANSLDENFHRAVDMLRECRGKIVLTGVGKSAIAAQKICATLNSIGIVALFLHAGDAVHGDMGVVKKEDVIIAISKSGDTSELKVLIPLLKNMGVSIIGITSNRESFLFRSSDVAIYVPVRGEACPLGITPTASVIAHIAVGDALAMSILKIKKIGLEDFGRNHPAGIIGKKIYMKVADVLAGQKSRKPFVYPDTPMPEVIMAITEGMVGAVVVLNNDQICGIITDGDIRRMLGRTSEWTHLRARDIMTTNPKTIEASELAVEALHMINRYKITQLVVVDNGKYVGILHFHDLVREGIM